MANNVQDMMLDSLLKASRAAEQITPAVDRAKAYTELAKACAMAIQTKGSTDIPITESPKEVPKVAKRSSKKAVPAVEEKKEEPKAEPEPIQEVTEEEIQQESEPEPVSIIKPKSAPVKKVEPVKESEVKAKKTPEEMEAEEYDLTTEWTPKAYEILAEDIKEVQRYVTMFKNDEESLNAMISAATEGVATSQEDINPLNIRVVLKYIKDLEQAELSKGE